MMTERLFPRTVYIVVDPSYGERLHDLPPGTPVWIVDTPGNDAAATERVERHPEEDQFTGLTTFKPDGESPAEWCLNILDIVEEHHPRFRELRVIRHGDQRRPAGRSGGDWND